MQIVWSKIIEEFGPKFGLSKEQIEDTFNKPDKTESNGGIYVTIKYYTGYAVILTFFYENNKAHFMNCYKVFPDMLTVDVDKVTSTAILQDFMERFGMETDVPGIGRVKTHLDEVNHKFFQGILDIEKYMEVAKGRL